MTRGVSRSKLKAIANPELAHAHPNRPQKAIGKRSPSFQSKPAKPPLNHRSPRSHIGTFMMHHDQKAVKETYASVYCHDHILARFFLRLEGEAAYFLGQRALPPPNSFHFSQGQGLWLDLRGRTPWDPSFLLGRLDSERLSLCNAGS